MSLSRRSLSILSAIRRARTAPRKLTSTIRAAEPWKYPKSLHQGENETSQNVWRRSPATTAAERRHSNCSNPAGLEHTKKRHPPDVSFLYLFESTRRDSNPFPIKKILKRKEFQALFLGCSQTVVKAKERA